MHKLHTRITNTGLPATILRLIIPLNSTKTSVSNSGNHLPLILLICRFDTEKINELNQTDHHLCMKQELENSKTVGIKLSLRGW